MDHRIEPGQEYETCQPIYHLNDAPTPTRIRILSTSGFGRATVATITDDGRELRQRLINARQLHADGTNRNGEQRRTGYRLVQHADGIPAGKAAGR
jgi:hypothetical protein